MNDVIQLSNFGFLSITGRDALKFLQGYTTCDLELLKPGGHGIGATCNIQGRMLTNYRIVAIEHGFLLRMHGSLIEPTMTFLKKYIVFSKAALKDESANYHCYGSIGPLTDATTQPINDCITIQVSTVGPRHEHWCQTNIEACDDPQHYAEWQLAELNEGYVWLEAATREELIPQMLNLQRFGGISFTKGCYLGQEIVARMQYRGVLKRRLHQGQSDTPVVPGSLILSSTGSKLGQVVAVAGQRFLAVVQISDGQDNDGTNTPFNAQLETGAAVMLSEVL
tara:strand:- start:154 stop:993 length:840 start_codon:yes stop_codon:yes gene_type:complete